MGGKARWRKLKRVVGPMPLGAQAPCKQHFKKDRTKTRDAKKRRMGQMEDDEEEEAAEKRTENQKEEVGRKPKDITKKQDEENDDLGSPAPEEIANHADEIDEKRPTSEKMKSAGSSTSEMVQEDVKGLQETNSIETHPEIESPQVLVTDLDKDFDSPLVEWIRDPLSEASLEEELRKATTEESQQPEVVEFCQLEAEASNVIKELESAASETMSPEDGQREPELSSVSGISSHRKPEITNGEKPVKFFISDEDSDSDTAIFVDAQQVTSNGDEAGHDHRQEIDVSISGTSKETDTKEETQEEELGFEDAGNDDKRIREMETSDSLTKVVDTEIESLIQFTEAEKDEIPKPGKVQRPRLTGISEPITTGTVRESPTLFKTPITKMADYEKQEMSPTCDSMDAESASRSSVSDAADADSTSRTSVTESGDYSASDTTSRTSNSESTDALATRSVSATESTEQDLVSAISTVESVDQDAMKNVSSPAGPETPEQESITISTAESLEAECSSKMSTIKSSEYRTISKSSTLESIDVDTVSKSSESELGEPDLISKTMPTEPDVVSKTSASEYTESESGTMRTSASESGEPDLISRTSASESVDPDITSRTSYSESVDADEASKTSMSGTREYLTSKSSINGSEYDIESLSSTTETPKEEKLPSALVRAEFGPENKPEEIKEQDDAISSKSDKPGGRSGSPVWEDLNFEDQIELVTDAGEGGELPAKSDADAQSLFFSLYPEYQPGEDDTSREKETEETGNPKGLCFRGQTPEQDEDHEEVYMATKKGEGGEGGGGGAGEGGGGGGGGGEGRGEGKNSRGKGTVSGKILQLQHKLSIQKKSERQNKEVPECMGHTSQQNRGSSSDEKQDSTKDIPDGEAASRRKSPPRSPRGRSLPDVLDSFSSTTLSPDVKATQRSVSGKKDDVVHSAGRRPEELMKDITASVEVVAATLGVTEIGQDAVSPETAQEALEMESKAEGTMKDRKTLVGKARDWIKGVTRMGVKKEEAVLDKVEMSDREKEASTSKPKVLTEMQRNPTGNDNRQNQEKDAAKADEGPSETKEETVQEETALEAKSQEEGATPSTGTEGEETDTLPPEMPEAQDVATPKSISKDKEIDHLRKGDEDLGLSEIEIGKDLVSEGHKEVIDGEDRPNDKDKKENVEVEEDTKEVFFDAVSKEDDDSVFLEDVPKDSTKKEEEVEEEEEKDRGDTKEADEKSEEITKSDESPDVTPTTETAEGEVPSDRRQKDDIMDSEGSEKGAQMTSSKDNESESNGIVKAEELTEGNMQMEKVTQENGEGEEATDTSNQMEEPVEKQDEEPAEGGDTENEEQVGLIGEMGIESEPSNQTEEELIADEKTKELAESNKELEERRELIPQTKEKLELEKQKEEVAKENEKTEELEEIDKQVEGETEGTELLEKETESNRLTEGTVESDETPSETDKKVKSSLASAEATTVVDDIRAAADVASEVTEEILSPVRVESAENDREEEVTELRPPVQEAADEYSETERTVISETENVISPEDSPKDGEEAAVESPLKIRGISDLQNIEKETITKEEEAKVARRDVNTDIKKEKPDELETERKIEEIPSSIDDKVKETSSLIVEPKKEEKEGEKLGTASETAKLVLEMEQRESDQPPKHAKDERKARHRRHDKSKSPSAYKEGDGKGEREKSSKRDREGKGGSKRRRHRRRTKSQEEMDVQALQTTEVAQSTGQGKEASQVSGQEKQPEHPETVYKKEHEDTEGKEKMERKEMEKPNNITPPCAEEPKLSSATTQVKTEEKLYSPLTESPIQEFEMKEPGPDTSEKATEAPIAIQDQSSVPTEDPHPAQKRKESSKSQKEKFSDEFWKDKLESGHKRHSKHSEKPRVTSSGDYSTSEHKKPHRSRREKSLETSTGQKDSKEQDLVTKKRDEPSADSPIKVSCPAGVSGEGEAGDMQSHFTATAATWSPRVDRKDRKSSRKSSSHKRESKSSEKTRTHKESTGSTPQGKDSEAPALSCPDDSHSTEPSKHTKRMKSVKSEAPESCGMVREGTPIPCPKPPSEKTQPQPLLSEKRKDPSPDAKTNPELLLELKFPEGISAPLSPRPTSQVSKPHFQVTTSQTGKKVSQPPRPLSPLKILTFPEGISKPVSPIPPKAQQPKSDLVSQAKPAAVPLSESSQVPQKFQFPESSLSPSSQKLKYPEALSKPLSPTLPDFPKDTSKALSPSPQDGRSSKPDISRSISPSSGKLKPKEEIPKPSSPKPDEAEIPEGRSTAPAKIRPKIIIPKPQELPSQALKPAAEPARPVSPLRVLVYPEGISKPVSPMPQKSQQAFFKSPSPLPLRETARPVSPLKVLTFPEGISKPVSPLPQTTKPVFKPIPKKDKPEGQVLDLDTSTSASSTLQKDVSDNKLESDVTKALSDSSVSRTFPKIISKSESSSPPMDVTTHKVKSKVLLTSEEAAAKPSPSTNQSSFRESGSVKLHSSIPAPISAKPTIFKFPDIIPDATAGPPSLLESKAPVATTDKPSSRHTKSELPKPCSPKPLERKPSGGQSKPVTAPLNAEKVSDPTESQKPLLPASSPPALEEREQKDTTSTFISKETIPKRTELSRHHKIGSPTVKGASPTPRTDSPIPKPASPTPRIESPTPKKTSSLSHKSKYESQFPKSILSSRHKSPSEMLSSGSPDRPVKSPQEFTQSPAVSQTSLSYSEISKRFTPSPKPMQEVLQIDSPTPEGPKSPSSLSVAEKISSTVSSMVMAQASEARSGAKFSCGESSRPSQKRMDSSERLQMLSDSPKGGDPRLQVQSILKESKEVLQTPLHVDPHPADASSSPKDPTALSPTPPTTHSAKETLRLSLDTTRSLHEGSRSPKDGSQSPHAGPDSPSKKLRRRKKR